MDARNTKKFLMKITIISFLTNISNISAIKSNDINIDKTPSNIITINNKNINNVDITSQRPKIQESISESISSASVKVDNFNYLTNKNFLTKNYKPILAITAALTAYGTSCYTIYCCKNYLEKADLWSNWKNDLSIEKLMAVPQDVLAREVFEAIKTKYRNKESNNNIIVSLTQFTGDIEKEKKTLTTFDNVYKFSKKYYILKLFPIDTNIFESINEKLERLAYIKNVFLSSEYVNNYDKIYISKKKF